MPVDLLMGASTNLVVTCSGRKTLPVAPTLRLRNHSPDGSIAGRFRSWTRAVEVDQSPRVDTNSLYAGDHWAVARATAASRAANLWVMSAGLGLLPSATPIPAYSASFSGGPDTVGTTDEQAEWWSLLNDWRPGFLQGTRSIRQLVANRPYALTLIVASPPYLAAIIPDLLATIQVPGLGENIVIVSSTLPADPILADRTVCSDRRLQPLVGGSMVSLNIRTARWLLEAGFEGDVATMQQKVAEGVEVAPPLPLPDRRRASDAELRRLIRNEIRTNPSASASGLLSSIRRRGIACEQKRFRALFLEERKQLAS